MDANTSDLIASLHERVGLLTGENLRLQYENRKLAAQVSELRDQNQRLWETIEDTTRSNPKTYKPDDNQ